MRPKQQTYRTIAFIRWLTIKYDVVFVRKTWSNNSAPKGLLLYKIDFILIKHDRCGRPIRFMGSVGQCVFIKQGYN